MSAKIKWAVKDPNGWFNWIERTRGDSIRAMELGTAETWGVLRGYGYRCVRVRITEIRKSRSKGGKTKGAR